MKQFRRLLALLLAALLLPLALTASAARAGAGHQAQPGETVDIWLSGYTDVIDDEHPGPRILSAPCTALWELGAHTVEVGCDAACASMLAPADGVYLVSSDVTEFYAAKVHTTNLIGPLDYYSAVFYEYLLGSETQASGKAVQLQAGEELIVAWRNTELTEEQTESASITVTALGKLTALTPPAAQGAYRTWEDVDSYMSGPTLKYFFHAGPAPLYWDAAFENGAHYAIDLDFTAEEDLMRGGSFDVTVSALGFEQTCTLDFVSIDNLIADLQLPADFTPEIRMEEVKNEAGETALAPAEFALPAYVTVSFTDGSTDTFLARHASDYEHGDTFAIRCPQGYMAYLDVHYEQTSEGSWTLVMIFPGNGRPADYRTVPAVEVTPEPEPGPLAQFFALLKEIFSTLVELFRSIFAPRG